MADSATASNYEITVEDAGPARKRLTVTVPPEMIQEKLENAMGTLASQSQLPGFRKGRAPMALLERRFGTQVREETRNQVFADGYAAAIEEKEIKPLGEPEPVGELADLVIEAGKPLTFSVEVEIVPEFDLPDLENVHVRKPMIDVTDEHIESELMRQRTQAGQIVEIESGFAEGDRVLGPGWVKKTDEDEPFFEHDAIDVIVPGEAEDGRGHVLGLIVDGLADMLKDKKVGDELEITVTGPDSHELEHVRGKELLVHVNISAGQRIEPAELDTVLTQYGMASEEILREQIKLALEQRRDEEQRGAMREQIYAWLLDAVDFELPRKMNESQTARMLEQQRLEMLYRGGVSVDEVERRLADMRAETETESAKRLKMSFILHRLAEHFGVEVMDQEINTRIAQIALQRGMRPEQLRSEMIQSGAVRQIAVQIREHRAADRVIDKAEVEEISAEDWNKLAQEDRKAKS